VSDIVVDSSVVAKWVLPEADSPQAQQLLSETATEGGSLVILDLALVEVTNAIWKQHHQGAISSDEAKRFLDCLVGIPVRIEPARELLPLALEIAIAYGRAVYDALFVALAQRTGLQGITADGPLYNAVHAKFPQIVFLRDWRLASRPTDAGG
jgi:predicted nucleic acid-binding protein